MKKFYVLFGMLLTFFGARGQSIQTYTINQGGTFQWKVPCDVSSITVEAWGAGAGGSSNGGGGGGAYAKRTFSVTPGAFYTIQVGSGGEDGWWSTTEGGNTVFGGNLVKAEGGGQGNNYQTGGRAAHSIGTIKYSGGNGVNGSGRGGGGGGSSATGTTNGNHGENTGNNNGGNGGAASAPDGGNGGNGGDSEQHWYGYSGEDGQNGAIPGGGGGQGGSGSGWGGGGDHGAGADGKMIITYTGSSSYCVPTIGNNVEPISRVIFSNIDHTSDPDINDSYGYEMLCNPKINVIKGNTYLLTVKGNTNDGWWYSRTAAFTAFIDWNQDGDFNDTQERIHIGTITGSNGVDSKFADQNITIPSFASVGQTRLRIIKNRNDYPNNACAQYQNGQIEDYILNVEDQNATITGFTPGNGCVGTSVTITGTNLSGATSVKFNGTNASFTVLNPTTITATVPNGATTGKISVTTSSNTAISSGSFMVNPSTVVSAVSGGGVHCSATNLTASGTGDIYFQGTNPNGTSTATGSTATVNASGTYYFRSFNGSCWSTAKSVVVTIEQLPSAVAVSGAGTFCGPTVINATGGGGYQIYFQGTTSGGTSTSDPATSKTISTSGTYYFRARSACGWGPEGAVTVVVNPLPEIVAVSAGDIEFCGATGTTLTASGGSGGTIYYQGTTSGGTSTADARTSITVYNGGTYYFRARSAAGCWGTEGSITVTEAAGFAITTQPQNTTVCTGQNAQFSVTVNPASGVSYQWFKNGTPISGATSGTFTIPGAQPADASYDIYCVITDACGSATTHHVALTVNNPVTAPTAQPANLQFVTGATSIGGTFSTIPADGYLVVRTNTAAAPSSPVDGVIYTQGQNALGGIIESSGPENIFSSSGLAQGTTYYYWVFAYNMGSGSCGTSPDYLNVNPLTGNATTALTTSCANVITLYWAGEGSTIPGHSEDIDFNDYRNWSLNATSYQQSPSAPTECTDVVIKLRHETLWIIPYLLGFDNNPNLVLSGDIKVHDLYLASEVGGESFLGIWEWESNSNVSLNLNGYKLEVFGNANIEVNYDENTVAIGDLDGDNGGIIDFKADVVIGNNNFNNGEAIFYGGSTTKAIFRGALTFGKLGGIDFEDPISAVFDNTATTVVTWNNTLNRASFRNVTIGVANSPVVTHGGSQIPNNILGNLALNNSSKLSLTKQWNRQSNGGAFTLNESATLLLYEDHSVALGGSATLVDGSNFPSGFSNISLATGSTVSYSGGYTLTQKVYDEPTYGAIILKNGNSSGIAHKINDGAIRHKGLITIEKNTSWALGGNIVDNGDVRIQSAGTLLMNTFLNTGTGSFMLHSGGSLGIGSPHGISTSGATGNVQNSGARTFSNDANYIYNGTVHQITGTGLPSKQRTLEVNNTAHVALTSDAEPVQLLRLTEGNLEIKEHTLTLNNVAYHSGRLTGSDLSNLTIRGTGVGMYFSNTLKGNYIKELNLLENASGQISPSTGDTLNITGGYNAPGQAGHLILGTGSRITTANGNFTLKSNAFGTASISEIPQLANGNINATIAGPVIVERYINVGTSTSLGQHSKAWHFLATPTTGQTIRQSWMENGATPDGYGIMLSGPGGTAGGWDVYSRSPSIKYYDPSAQFEFTGASSASNQLYNQNGWMVFIRGDRSVTGYNATPNNTTLRSKGTVLTGRRTINIPGVEGFYAIGNPYASEVDVRGLLAPSNGTTFYVWNPNLGGDYGYGAYQTFTYVDGDFEIVPDRGTVNNFILSGQAFFVQSFAGSPYTVQFDESDKGNSAANKEYFRSGGVMNKPSGMLRTAIANSSGDIIDGTLQLFGDQYSSDVNQQDGRKMYNSGINIALHVQHKFLAVETRENINRKDTIFFHLNGIGNGNYQFEFNASRLSAPGLEAWLEDAYTGTKTPMHLEGNTEISFSVSGATASKAADRFRIVFENAQGPLPVNFVGIDALKKYTDILVRWKVAQEINVEKYIVEKSIDGTHFSDLGTVAADKAAGGIYEWTDTHPSEGANYYRIRSVDKDGKDSYSSTVQVWMGNMQPSINVYPNPVRHGRLNLNFEYLIEGAYRVRLLNPAGQTMLKKMVEYPGGKFREVIPWDYNLPHGVYQLEITKPDGNVHVIKVAY